MNQRLAPLARLSFILALVTLLINDFYLKYEYHNWATGKLSDVAGLFVFVYFWTTVFPTKKNTVCIITALVFVYWKSAYSEPFIDFFSENIYLINRTIDATDLLALLVLPISYSVDSNGSVRNQIPPIPIALLTLFFPP